MRWAKSCRAFPRICVKCKTGQTLPQGKACPVLSAENQKFPTIAAVISGFCGLRKTFRKAKKSNNRKGYWTFLRRHLNRSPKLAGDEGFEPSQTESESVVLPLHKSPIFSDFLQRIYYSKDTQACQVYFCKKNRSLYLIF